MTRDGGARTNWMCMRGAFDAGGCPAVPPMTGSMCMTAGQVCPYALETCTCQMAMGRGGRDRWACTVGGLDSGGGG
jgi:hypothetical protein